MDDKKLLELAVMSAGYKDIKHDESGFYRVIGEHEDGTLCMVQFNPLTDDGDALRLAVKLKVDVIPSWGDNCVCVIGGGDHFEESQKPDEFAAMRRAIVRAAAAIGEQMKGNQ